MKNSENLAAWRYLHGVCAYRWHKIDLVNATRDQKIEYAKDIMELIMFPIPVRGCPSECGCGRLQVGKYNGLCARRCETTTDRRYRTQMDTPLPVNQSFTKELLKFARVLLVDSKQFVEAGAYDWEFPPPGTAFNPEPDVGSPQHDPKGGICQPHAVATLYEINASLTHANEQLYRLLGG